MARAQDSTAAEGQAATADTAETKRVQILHADSLVGAIVDNARVRRLLGHVRLLQGKTRLRARRAIQYEARDEILFTGAVRIIDEGDTLWAKRARYDTQRKIGRATGNVRLTDGEVIVRAPSGRYFAREDRAAFEQSVTLVDSATVLKSRRGVYFTEEERAEFYGNVRLWNEDTYLEADSVTYLRKEDISIASGHVFIRRFDVEEETADAPDGAQGTTLRDTTARGATARDTTARTLLFGQHAYHDEQRSFSRVTGRALLVQLRNDSTGVPKDTLLMRAHQLRVLRADSLERLIAIDSVHAWQRDLAAVADSAVYLRFLPPDSAEAAPVREVTRLYQDPIAWHADAQLSGDTIRIVGRNRSIDTLFVPSNAFAAQRDTTLERIQQLKGRRLTAFFKQDSLRRIVVGPNARAIRFMADEKGELRGAVQVSADEIRFWIHGGEIQRLRASGGVQGTQYGAAQVPDPFHLDGFRWLPERRPTKAALLQRERVRRRLRAPSQPELPPPVARRERGRVGDREREGGVDRR